MQSTCLLLLLLLQSVNVEAGNSVGLARCSAKISTAPVVGLFAASASHLQVTKPQSICRQARGKQVLKLHDAGKDLLIP